MCGRFTLTLDADELAGLFDASPSALPPGQRYNVCPTQDIAVVLSAEDGRHIVPMRWGFVPRWAKSLTDGPLLINARAETIAEKAAFRQAARERRCIVPASGFYEWTKAADGGKDPWYIAPVAAPVLPLAGIWQSWGEGDSRRDTVAIVTTGANATLSAIHHRMPVIISPDSIGLWLGESGKGAATLMQPAPDNLLKMHRVNRRVNGARQEDATLIEPENIS